MAEKVPTGPLRLCKAIAAADLSGMEKAALNGLAPHTDWETWRAYPSVATIARNAGWKVRAIQTALASLERKGVVVCHPRVQQTSVYTIVMSALERLADPASGAPLRVHVVRGEGASGAPLRVHVVRGEGASGARRGAPRAPEHTREQTNEHTTTTTRAGGGGGGGGGGGEIETGRQDRIEARLIDAGLSPAKAEELAADPRIDDCRLAFALEQGRAKSTKDPGALIASLLTMPEEQLRGFVKFRERWERRHRERLEVAASGGAGPRPADPFVRAPGEQLATPIPLREFVEQKRAARRIGRSDPA